MESRRKRGLGSGSLSIEAKPRKRKIKEINWTFTTEELIVSNEHPFNCKCESCVRIRMFYGTTDEEADELESIVSKYE